MSCVCATGKECKVRADVLTSIKPIGNTRKADFNTENVCEKFTLPMFSHNNICIYAVSKQK